MSLERLPKSTEKPLHKTRGFKRLQLGVTAGIVLTLTAISPSADGRGHENSQDGITIEPVVSEGIKIELGETSIVQEKREENFNDIFDDVFNEAVNKKLAKRLETPLNIESIQIEFSRSSSVILNRGLILNDIEGSETFGSMVPFKAMDLTYDTGNGVNIKSEKYIAIQGLLPEKHDIDYVVIQNQLFLMGNTPSRTDDKGLLDAGHSLQFKFGVLKDLSNPWQKNRYRTT
jgi:hypothetical protein